jgi:hypothetical protein
MTFNSSVHATFCSESIPNSTTHLQVLGSTSDKYNSLLFFFIEALYFPLFFFARRRTLFLLCDYFCVVADGVTEEEQDREPEPEDPYLEEELSEGFEDGKSNPIL